MCALVNEEKTAGEYYLTWNIDNNKYNIPITGGIYFCRISAPDKSCVQKFLIVGN